jgi:hypothetical protein
VGHLTCVPKVTSQTEDSLVDHPICLRILDHGKRSVVVTVFAHLVFSYVFAFVVLAWSSGIAALR